jgi:hypothetical protein
VTLELQLFLSNTGIKFLNPFFSESKNEMPRSIGGVGIGMEFDETLIVK